MGGLRVGRAACPSSPFAAISRLLLSQWEGQDRLALQTPGRFTDPEPGRQQPFEDGFRSPLPLEPPLEHVTLFGPRHPQHDPLHGIKPGQLQFGVVQVKRQDRDEGPAFQPPEGILQVRLKPLNPALRQLVMHEIEMERIRRAAEMATLRGREAGEHVAAEGQHMGPTPQKRPVAGPVMRSIEERMRGNNAATRAQADREAAAAANPRRATWLDDMKKRKAEASKPLPALKKKATEVRCRLLQLGSSRGYPLNRPPSPAQLSGADPARTPNSGAKAAAAAAGVLYKYHEGFTNAVKRPLLMRDLL